MENQQPQLSYIVEPLRNLAAQISEINPDPINARLHSVRNIEAVKASLAKFGQRIPIVVQKQGMIVRAGNARLEAAKALGWTHIAAIVVDESDLEATAFGIADNRTAELAEWDEDTLLQLLRQLKADEKFDFPVTGFNEEELEYLLEKSRSATEEMLRAFKLTHVLLSFQPEKMIEVQPYLDKIAQIEGIQIEQSSN